MTSVLESSRASGGAGGQVKGKSKRRRRRRSKRKAENSGWVHTLLPRISHRLQERCNTQFGTWLDATDHRLSSQSETPHGLATLAIYLAIEAFSFGSWSNVD